MVADAYLEPLIVFTILTAGVVVNRRRSPPAGDGTWSPTSSPSAEGLLSPSINEPQYRERKFFGRRIQSRNTARWKNTLASRLLRKFPFLVEVWYWLLVYWVSFALWICGGFYFLFLKHDDIVLR
jgi:hypothetical protein